MTMYVLWALPMTLMHKRGAAKFFLEGFSYSHDMGFMPIDIIYTRTDFV